MNIENQVISLKLSKKLKELGVVKESYFKWYQVENNEWGIGHPQKEWKQISAYTVAELGEILSNHITIPECDPFEDYRILIEKFMSVEDSFMKNNYIINYECTSTETWLRRKLTSNTCDPNLANALAKMLIYLIENKLMEINIT